MQEHILRNRVAGYRERDLLRHLYRDGAVLPAEHRTAFEHHLPDSAVLVAFPVEAWPHLLGAMHARTKQAGAWSGRLTPRERELSTRILAEIAVRGPLSAEDTELVGHVDPKADREAGRLRVVSRRVRRGCRVAPAVKELAAFLGLKG